MAPLAAVGVQVVGVQPLGFVQAIQYFPDVHYLMIKGITTSKAHFKHRKCIALKIQCIK